MKNSDLQNNINEMFKTLVENTFSIEGGGLRILSVAAIAGCMSFAPQGTANAETIVIPVLDSLQDSEDENSGTKTSSEYNLREITPADVNNLPINVIKYYDPKDNTTHYYEINFKHSEYGTGDAKKYFKWAKDGNTIKLVETNDSSSAVLTIKYNPSDAANKIYAAKGTPISSVSEINVGKDIYGLIGSRSRIENIGSKFIGNTINIESTDDYGYSAIYTEAAGSIGTITSSFIGNNINIDNGTVYGALIKSLGTIDNINGEFIGNNITSKGYVMGGLISTGNIATVGNITGDFIRNTASSDRFDIRGSVIRNDGTVSITNSKFIENTAKSTNGLIYGIVENAATSKGKGLNISDSIFIDNKTITENSVAYGGAIKNVGALHIENTLFKDNSVQTNKGVAHGGAIFSRSDLTVAANNGKVTEFTGNYTLNGETKVNEAIYIDSDTATLTFNATDNGRILLNDIINGIYGYNVVLSGDDTGRISIYNSILNADVVAESSNIDLQDGIYKTYDFKSLRADSDAKFSIDLDITNKNSDKFILGEGSNGTIYIDDINMKGERPTVAEKIQILTGPDTISVELTQKAFDKYYKETYRNVTIDDEVLDAELNWDAIYYKRDYLETTKEGFHAAISGEGRTTADSIEYFITPELTELNATVLDDTLGLLNRSDKFEEKTFNSNLEDQTYTLIGDLGKTSGKLNIVNKFANEYRQIFGSRYMQKNTIDAAGHTMFEIGNGSSVNIQEMSINNLADIDGAFMKISEGGSGTLSWVDVNGNANSAAIVNDGTLNLKGGNSYYQNSFTGGGIKGNGTTNILGYWDFGDAVINQDIININGLTDRRVYLEDGTPDYLGWITDQTYVSISADGLQGTTNLSSLATLYITGGTLNHAIHRVLEKNGSILGLLGRARDDAADLVIGEDENYYYGPNSNIYITGDTVINADIEGNIIIYGDALKITTNVDHLKGNITSNNWYSNDEYHNLLTLTGGTVTNELYFYDNNINIRGDVTIADSANVTFNEMNIDKTSSLTAYLKPTIYEYNEKTGDEYYEAGTYVYGDITNDGTITIGGEGEFYTYIEGNGKTNILGDITINRYIDSQDTLHIKDGGTLHIGGYELGVISNFINDSVLDLRGGDIRRDTVTFIDGTGTTKATEGGNNYAAYTDFGQQNIEIENFALLYISAEKVHTDIQNDGSLYIMASPDSDATATFSQNVSGDKGKTIFLWGIETSNDKNSSHFTSNIHNEGQINNSISIGLYPSSYTYNNLVNVWSNADLLNGEIDVYGSLYLTGGTLAHKAEGTGDLYIDTDSNVISNAIVNTKYLTLNDSANLTISADNLDSQVISLLSDSNLKLQSGEFNGKITGNGTVNILKNNEVQYEAGWDSNGNRNYISSDVYIEKGGVFTSEANWLANVDNDGTLYLNGTLSRGYTGDGTLYINEKLYLNPGAGFTGTFDLNNGSLISRSIGSYTFGHTINEGSLTFNFSPIGNRADSFTLASTSNGIFNIDSINISGWGDQNPTDVSWLENTTQIHQILKGGSSAILTLGEDQMYKELPTKDLTSERDRLGQNVYIEDPENRYFDDLYGYRHKVGYIPAEIELTTTDTENDSIKVTYGENVWTSISAERLDLLSDWNQLSTENERNFNFRTANDVYTSIANVGTSTSGTLNINGIAETTTDADGNTVINRSVIDLNGYSGFVSNYSTPNIINIENVEFRNASGRVFTTSNATFGTVLEDGTIQGGIVNCLFKDNHLSSGDGAALYLSSNTLVHQILNSTFSDNTANSDGGAIYNYNGTISNITDTTFSGNTSSSSSYYSGGGAIYNYKATISNIADTTFSGNTANTNGGAIFNSYGTIESIKNTTFSGNTANTNGGAIFNNGTIESIENTTFSGNKASYGGAIYNYGGTISNISDTTFSGNTASYGGAIYISSGTIESISDTTFSGNTASYGGAIYNNNRTINKIVNSTFENNKASYGGTIYNYCNSKIDTIDNVIFSSNSGDVIRNNGGSIGSISNSIFRNNTGDAIYSNNYNSSYIASIESITNSLFENNSGTAIYISNNNNGKTLTIENSIFKNTVASDYRSSTVRGLYAGTGSDIVISAKNTIGENGEIIKGVTAFTYEVLPDPETAPDTDLDIDRDSDIDTQAIVSGTSRPLSTDPSDYYKVINIYGTSSNSSNLTLSATDGGSIIMNGKIDMSSSYNNITLTGDSTGTIDLFGGVNSGKATVNNVLINTVNGKTQSHFYSLITDESVKWSIDVNFYKAKEYTYVRDPETLERIPVETGNYVYKAEADSFGAYSDSSGVLYIDNLNVINNIDKYLQAQVLEKDNDSTLEIVLNPDNIHVVTDIRDTLGDTVYNNEIYHQEEGYAVSSSRTWQGGYDKDMISQCIDEELDTLNLIAASEKHMIRNFIFRDGETYTSQVSNDLQSSQHFGLLNIIGIEGSTSTIDANGHTLFIGGDPATQAGHNNNIYLSDVKITGAETLFSNYGNLFVSGNGTTTLDGKVNWMVTLESGNLIINPDTMTVIDYNSMSQSGQSMLAQANQANQGVLELLKSSSMEKMVVSHPISAIRTGGGLQLKGGTLVLDNNKIEDYVIQGGISSVEEANLSLDLDLAAKTSDSITSEYGAMGVVTVSNINFLNKIEDPDQDDFIVQVIKYNDYVPPVYEDPEHIEDAESHIRDTDMAEEMVNFGRAAGSNGSQIGGGTYPSQPGYGSITSNLPKDLQLKLSEEIGTQDFGDRTRILTDELVRDTNWNDTFHKWSQDGKLYGEIYLATTENTNDSLGVHLYTEWDENSITDIGLLGDTFDLVNRSELDIRNFNSSSSTDIYGVSADLGETAKGVLNINGTLEDNGTRSTINFKNHKGISLGSDTTLSVNNTRLTGARDIITVDSANNKIILNNAFINGNIIGNEKFDITLDGVDITTIMGNLKNADVDFINGGLVIGENTFADKTTSLNVTDNAKVFLNDGEISNYNFSNLNSSILSKYGLDIDLKERTADTITAEGSGRIVLENFNILSNLTNVTLDDDYTIQILYTSDDSLQLEISETVKSQLNDDYKLGTVHELIKKDTAQPVANWGDRWEVIEGDYDVYGKLKLSTNKTKNDSLHLYGLNKVLASTTTELGDTLMLVSTLDTNEDRRFWTDEVTTYNLTEDIGDVTAGKMALEGATDGTNLSIIDMGAHKGFKLSNETEITASNIKFTNTGFKDGSLFNLTNKDAILNLENVIITEISSSNAIKNEATVNFIGGNNTLYSGISGTGVTNVNGGELHLAEGLAITQDTINVNSGLLDVAKENLLVANLTVGEAGRVILANTNALTSAVANEGEVRIGEGTLLQNINGNGSTGIDGKVINNANISQNVYIAINGDLTSHTDNIAGDINNAGILNLTGTLNKVVTDNGTTNINESLNLATGAGIEGTLNLNDGAVSTQDNTTSTYQIGTMLNEGNFGIDVDLSEKVSDLFNVGNDSKGKVYIETINFLNNSSLKEGESFTIQVLETNGTDAIQIALNEALKLDRIAIGTTNDYDTDLRATVAFNEKFHDRNHTGTIYATLSEGTTKTTNDSITLSYSGVEWNDPINTERKDTLKELTQFDTDEEKNFNFKEAGNKYTVEEDLGEATDGVLNINGVADGDEKSKIDLNDHSGFELTNDTTLNIKDVEIGGGKDDKIIVATNPDAEINIENSTINGDIDGNGTEINIGGADGDKTILNGKVTGSDTTLDGGTLVFNPDTFGDDDDTLTIKSGRIDVKDDSTDTYEINKLTSSEDGRYSIDVDLNDNSADKFKVTDPDSSGTVYIDDINFINGDSPDEFKAQILDTNGNEDIQVKLSDEIKNKVYDFGTTERTWDDLKASVNSDEKFHDFTQIGDIYGSIKEATSVTMNDSIELVKNDPIWREDDITSKERIDTLHEIAAYQTDVDKSFNFVPNSETYGSKADVGIVNGTLSVNGDTTGENKSDIDLSAYSGFEVGNGTTLNLNDVDIFHGKNNTLITAIETGAIVNIENNTLTGNILGKDTQINITGNDNDTTVLNGRITDSDTTLNGGTLKFNTDTFGDIADTLTVNSGHVDIKDGSINTYDITKLTSSENAHYSIDVDLSNETADKLNITDTDSSGIVYIDDIKYLNGELGKEFKAQVLETNNNNDIQIKLSEEIKSQLYNVGTTEKSWNDLKSDVYFDENFHDYHQDGTIQGAITEATTKTTNDSIALEVTGIDWAEKEVTDRLDTLHELSVYDSEIDKNFNFRESGNEYISKTDVGIVNGTLSINGVSDGEEKSSVNLAGHSGFEMNTDSVLNLIDVEVKGGKSDNIVVALTSDATVNIENGTVNGNIRGNNTEINITGDGSDITVLNGLVTDSDTTLDGGTLKFNPKTFGDKDDTLTVKSGRVDVQDSKVDTYDITKLTSSENGKYSIDVDLTSQESDKFVIADKTSSGTVYLDKINYINGELPSEFIVQVLETNGNNNLQIKLSDEIKNNVYNFGTTEKNWDDLKANVDFDELFHDYNQIGDLRGQIKEATTNTTNDSISLKMDDPIWREITHTDRIDTLHEISAYDTESDKTFNFKTSLDEYESKTDVGEVNGTLTINGIAESEEKSSIDLNGHGGFELTPDTVLNLIDVEISGGKNDTLISSNTSGGVVNIENNTLIGNIIGNNTKININGKDKDTTILDGSVVGSDTTLNGGTLKFNPETFEDKNDSLTIESGRIDVQDSKIDTYDINKLTSSENGKYSIDIDLTTDEGDKFNITDKTSSGVVYIDDINFINGELPKEFTAQILETNGNNGIQIKLSDEIKSKIYDFGKTEREWNDLKADVNFDELFHDYHQEGELLGSIKESTTKTTNDSISYKEETVWGEIQTASRLDTLHEISVYNEADKKTFNFKTANDVYDSKANLGDVSGELAINGVKQGDKYSKINLNKFKGFELGKGSKLKVNSTRLTNGAENTLITAKDAEAEITLNNSQVDGVITGVNGYTVNITGDNSHIFDVNNEIKNAKINVDTVQLDMYNPRAFSSSDIYMNSGTLNMTVDRAVSDMVSNTFTINNTFKMLADADLYNQVMDKLPANTTIAPNAFVNVSGINLLSDTTALSVAIPFAYKGFKDNVQYSGSSVLSDKTQITTAYAPIFKYDISYENREDMGYFVFSRHGSNSGNSSDSYNPSVLASPVATQASGQATMNETFRYVFEHADAFTQLPMMDRLTQIKANQIAMSTDFNHNLGSLCTEHNNKAGWYRPYSTFESIRFDNGPKISSVNYGSIVGYDSDFYSLKNDWTTISTGYAGYNGSQLNYRGVDTTTNGGLLGATQTFYKGNFWTAITATAGASVAETHTMYGKEESSMLMAGIGTKTGYNFEFNEGKFIVQPIMFVSYTFVNTFDYTNSAGVRIKNDPMHTIQLHPSVRFIGNIKGGWQPYASLGAVWNIMNKSSSTANGIELPEMHTKPYVEYGLGLQKNVSDHFTAFGQAMLRSGGRSGIALTAGFRWAIGHDHDNEHEHAPQKVHQDNGTQNAQNKTIIKRVSNVKHSKSISKKI